MKPGFSSSLDKEIPLIDENRTRVQIVRPMITFVSSHDYNEMKKLCNDDEKADCFIQKPLKMIQMKAIL